MEKLRKARVSHFARRLAVFTAAGLLLVEGCACTKQYKENNINRENMAYRERILTPQKEKGGEDSLKVVPKKLTPEEKMKAKLDSINKKLDEISDEDYRRHMMRPSERPPKDYRKALIELTFVGDEKRLYEAALKKDKTEVERAKSDILRWGKESGDEVRAIKILDDFDFNSK